MAMDILKGLKDAATPQPSDKGALAAVQNNIDQYQAATKSAAPAPAKPYQPSPKDKVGQGAYGSRGKEKRIDTKDMTKPLGSFKKGGKVKKTGMYKLHAKERVLNAKQSAKVDKKGMKSLFGK